MNLIVKRTDRPRICEVVECSRGSLGFITRVAQFLCLLAPQKFRGANVAPMRISCEQVILGRSAYVDRDLDPGHAIPSASLEPAPTPERRRSRTSPNWSLRINSNLSEPREEIPHRQICDDGVVPMSNAGSWLRERREELHLTRSSNRAPRSSHPWTSRSL